MSSFECVCLFVSVLCAGLFCSDPTPTLKKTLQKKVDAISARELGAVNAYNPGLSSAWMLQRAMTAARSPSSSAPPRLINAMLGANFGAMAALGDGAMRPFLQDVIRFAPLMATMGAQVLRDPLLVPSLLVHVGPGPLADWVRHTAALGAYELLHRAAAPLLRRTVEGSLAPRERWRLRRLFEAWEYGCGADYER